MWIARQVRELEIGKYLSEGGSCKGGGIVLEKQDWPGVWFDGWSEWGLRRRSFVAENSVFHPVSEITINQGAEASDFVLILRQELFAKLWIDLFVRAR
jgi:hypothetical protein